MLGKTFLAEAINSTHSTQLAFYKYVTVLCVIGGPTESFPFLMAPLVPAVPLVVYFKIYTSYKYLKSAHSGEYIFDFVSRIHIHIS
jgi:hypothetical protein